MEKPNQYQRPLSEAMEELEKAGKSLRVRIHRILARLGYTGLIAVLALVMAAVMVLRFYGLPSGLRDFLLQELESRGITASVDRLVLDPTGGIVAERVSVYRTPARNDLWLQVDRVRIGIAWFSWWRGGPFIQSASVANADIRYPLTEKSTVEISQVGADVDFQPGYLQVRRARARCLNLELNLKGRIALPSRDHPLPSHPRTPEENARIDRLWGQVLQTADDLDTSHPIQVELDFDAQTAQPATSTLHALVGAQMFRWHGALVDEFAMKASLENGLASLTEFRIRLARGEFKAVGEANLQDKTGRLDVNSDLDFTPLAEAFGSRAQPIISRLNFSELPLCTAQIQLGWGEQKPSVNLQADVDWTNFSYGPTQFQRLTIPIAYDGNRLFVSDAEIATTEGGIKGKVLCDFSKPEIKGRVTSNLNPTVLKGIFGPGADAFLNSLEFSGSAPNLDFQITGNSRDPMQWLISGKVAADNLSYKKVALQSIRADCSFHDMELDVPNLVVVRKEGQLTGGICENFRERWVRITNLQATILVDEADVVLGDKFVSYVDKYQLDRPANLKVDGLVDLNDKKPSLDTDFKVQISGQTNLSYFLFKKKFVIVNPVGEVTVRNRDLGIKIQDGRLFDGPVSGNITVKLVRTPAEKSDFTLKLGVKNADFKQMMSSLFKNEKTAGRFDLNTSMIGKVSDLATINGSGDILMSDGYLMNIPLMSGLTFIVDNIIPGFGLSKVDRARASFTLGAGVLTTKDLNMSSAIFSILGNGGYNYLTDQVDMDMRVNVSGVIGWFTQFVSKIFEYHGKGPLGDVKWGPKILGN